jgi:hypothetical protein
MSVWCPNALARTESRVSADVYGFLQCVTMSCNKARIKYTMVVNYSLLCVFDKN